MLFRSGGMPDGGAMSEAETMKAVLENEFRVPVTWMETASSTTYNQASNVMHILGPSGMRRIQLVTHAWHMPRAQAVFTQAGFDVIPAPTQFVEPRETTVLDFMPSASALRDSHHFFHEVLGLAWYRLKSKFR